MKLKKHKIINDINEVIVKYPSLHFVNQNNPLMISGTFPLIHKANTKELDRYWIEIEIPNNYPTDIPILREIGGRIPRIKDRHIEKDGKACLFLEEEINKYFPKNATLLQFIENPVFDFLFGQTYFELTEKKYGKGKWIFEEWSHGAEGIYDFYSQLLNTEDKQKIKKFVYFLSIGKLDLNKICFCGSNKILGQCHKTLLFLTKQNIKPQVAKKSFEALSIFITKNKDLKQ